MLAIFVRHAKLNNTNGGVLKPGLYRNHITNNRIKPFISEMGLATTPYKTENQLLITYTPCVSFESRFRGLRLAFRPISSRIAQYWDDRIFLVCKWRIYLKYILLVSEICIGVGGILLIMILWIVWMVLFLWSIKCDGYGLS